MKFGLEIWLFLSQKSIIETIYNCVIINQTVKNIWTSRINKWIKNYNLRVKIV
jgi:hypothetical protein